MSVIRPAVTMSVPDLSIHPGPPLFSRHPDLRGEHLLTPHGWNMAFDHAADRLNGIYDFGDSGFGPLHQEFMYSNFIAGDLTGSIVAAYEALTGRALDRERIDLLSGVLRLAELAAHADDPDRAPAMIRFVADWHEMAMARGGKIG